MSPPVPSAADAIRRKALALGFDRVGFCDARLPPEAAHLDRWLAAGMHGSMDWMLKDRERRLDPQRLLKGARSFVVVALSHARAGSPTPPGSGRGAPAGRIARYAQGEDYHLVIGRRLAELERFIEETSPKDRALAYVDTGAILERMWAARAGIGWIGKNSLVLNRAMGSFFLLGVVITTLELPPDPPATDQCGSCDACISACPTGAIVADRFVDSRRCISYHTIELRDRIPAEHRETIGTRLIGCDDCQDACPWNPPQPLPATLPLLELLTITRDEYVDRFRGSAIKRATHDGLRRNAALALGNLGSTAPGPAADLLEAIAADPAESEILREQADWSTRRIRRQDPIK